MDFALLGLLAVLLVFMFWSSRRRMQRQKAEQEAKAKQTVPGAEVLLQGGLYGTIVSFDSENLDAPAIVEIAPGVEIKVHSQAILRIVAATEEETPDEGVYADDALEAERIDDATVPGDDRTVLADEAPATDNTAAAADSDSDSGSGAKPQA